MGILFVALGLLMTPVPAADASPAPAAPGDSELVFLTGCTAELHCGGDHWRVCTGANTCIVGPTYVECDGVRQDCSCAVQTTCCDGRVIDCAGTMCNVVPARSVRCEDQNGNVTAWKTCVFCKEW